jgi:hypothetical protein
MGNQVQPYGITKICEEMTRLRHCRPLTHAQARL